MSQRKDHLDGAGMFMLVGISMMLGMNQAMVKMVNVGMSPIFQAGLRSAAAMIPLVLYMLLTHKKFSISSDNFLPGIIAGLLFTFEFFLLFQALEYTSVARSAILFYTMPVWVTLGAHFLIPGEKITSARAIGLVLAVCGVFVALSQNQHPASDQALLGDLMALTAATGWAGLALVTKTTKLSKSTPEVQMLYQFAVSAPILLVIAFIDDQTFREMTAYLWVIFTYQVVIVAAFGFVLWFWVLSIYPASKMTSFSFLTPLFGVLFGWIIFNEQLTINIIVALILVGAGIYLVNRKPKLAPVS